MPNIDYRKDLDPKADWRTNSGLSNISVTIASKIFIKDINLVVSSKLSNFNVNRSYMSVLSIKGQNIF